MNWLPMLVGAGAGWYLGGKKLPVAGAALGAAAGLALGNMVKAVVPTTPRVRGVGDTGMDEDVTETAALAFIDRIEDLGYSATDPIPSAVIADGERFEGHQVNVTHRPEELAKIKLYAAGLGPKYGTGRVVQRANPNGSTIIFPSAVAV